MTRHKPESIRQGLNQRNVQQILETLPEVDREPLPEESTTEIIAESNTLSAEKLLAWISKFAMQFVFEEIFEKNNQLKQDMILVQVPK